MLKRVIILSVFCLTFLFSSETTLAVGVPGQDNVLVAQGENGSSWYIDQKLTLLRNDLIMTLVTEKFSDGTAKVSIIQFNKKEQVAILGEIKLDQKGKPLSQSKPSAIQWQSIETDSPMEKVYIQVWSPGFATQATSKWLSLGQQDGNDYFLDTETIYPDNTEPKCFIRMVKPDKSATVFNVSFHMDGTYSIEHQFKFDQHGKEVEAVRIPESQRKWLPVEVESPYARAFRFIKEKLKL